MAYTYEELKGKTLAQLREVAAGMEEHDAVQGYTQMNKEHLLQSICHALNIDMHKHHEVKGINKTTLKEQMKRLKSQREEALAAHNHSQLKDVRRRIHRLKRVIHKATV
jgi:response regulator of citrate/malate metabolism